MLWFNTCNYLSPWELVLLDSVYIGSPYDITLFPQCLGETKRVLLVPMLAGMGHCATSAVVRPSLLQFSCWLLFLFPLMPLSLQENLHHCDCYYRQSSHCVMKESIGHSLSLAVPLPLKSLPAPFSESLSWQ